MNKKILFILPFVIFIILVTFIKPEYITQTLGNQNSYLVMFLIALIGGISIFSSIPYPLFLITFSLGGLNPIILSLCTVTGVMIGDSFSYYFGMKGSKFISGKWEDLFKIILKFYDTKEKYLTLIFFLYGIISPFPNDIITLSAGIKRYNYLKMIIPLSLGNIIFCLLISYFADFFSGYFS